MASNTAVELEQKSSKELVDIYNNLTTGRKVIKFPDRKAAVRRILALRSEQKQAAAAKVAVADREGTVYNGPAVEALKEVVHKTLKSARLPASIVEKVTAHLPVAVVQALPQIIKAHKATTGAPRGPRAPRVFEIAPAAEAKSLRPSSKLARMVEMMSQKSGTTRAAMAQEFGWTPAMISCTLGRVAKLTGYGMTQNAEGVIRAIPPKKR